MSRVSFNKLRHRTSNRFNALNVASDPVDIVADWFGCGGDHLDQEVRGRQGPNNSKHETNQSDQADQKDQAGQQRQRCGKVVRPDHWAALRASV